jgi:ribonucleoside-diphosphate reductase alpha chain
LLRKIAEATHICGDPGLQYDTTINDWHTSSNTDRIYASNPCSEFVFLDDTACNLASLNLMKFRRADGEFDPDTFVHACEVFITAQEIIVSNASYPTEKIARNSEDYRPLGLGYANLGALLMAQGTAYDSDEGRALAAAITAIMTGSAYRQSAKIASNIGPFNGYAKNREPMLRVIGKHRDAVNRIDSRPVPKTRSTPRAACGTKRCCWARSMGIAMRRVRFWPLRVLSLL